MKPVCLVFLLLFTALLASASPIDKVSAGNPLPDFTFRTVLGSDGYTKLSELRGRPVIIAWYSTVFAGLEAARVAIELEKKHAKDGLAIFLMEIKRHDATFLHALQMKELPGVDCPLMRTQNLPVIYDDSTGLPPKMILVGVDGTLLYAGSYQGFSQGIKLLKKEIKKRKTGWGEAPLARKVRALAYGKGNLGEARVLLQEEMGDPAAEELHEVAAELTLRFETWKRSVNHRVEQGEPLRALKNAEALVKAVEDHPEWHKAAQELVDSFSTPELKRELALAQKLKSLLKPLRSKRPKKGIDARLAHFSAEAEGTKVGARATRLGKAAKLAQERLDE